MTPRAGLSLLYSQFFVKLPVPRQSFAGQTIIITGSNTGLGREAARHIIDLGAAKVILAVRDVDKGEAAKKYILTDSGQSNASGVVEVWELNLSNYESIKAFARRAESLDRLDAVIQNAGISTSEFKLVEGNESSLTINVISTYLLTLLLLPKLRSSAHAHEITPRISIVTSSVHNFTTLAAKSAPSILAEMNNPNSQICKMTTRYFDTKLLQVLYTRALADALTAQKGNQVVINMLNPGFCDSELFRDSPGAVKMQMKVMGRSAEEGSRALVDAVARGKESHGEYLSDCKVARVSDWARSKEGKETQERVWKEVNEKLEEIAPDAVRNIYWG